MKWTARIKLFFKRANARSLLLTAPVLLPLLLLVVSDWKSLDYGEHWDERPYQIGPVKKMVATGTLLPGFYQYPSLAYCVNLAVLAPDIAATMRTKNYESAQDSLQKILDGESYLLRLRETYLALSALTILWVYLLIARWRQSGIEALLASSFLALSWEVAYHLRWVATDGLLMQFGALTILLSMLAWVQPKGRLFWLRLAAIAAGFGCGTKYPGGLLIAPVLLCGQMICHHTATSRRRGRLPWRLSVNLILIFASAYLVCTPGTLFQPGKFLDGILYETRHYAAHGHYGHTVVPGFEHAWHMLVYLSAVLFSPYSMIALFFFALAMTGVGALIKESRQTALLFLCFPVLYLFFFSLQRVMLVRNLLIVAPFMSVMAARGTMWLWQRAKFAGDALRSTAKITRSLLQACIAIAVGACFLMNANWIIYAAQTVVDRHHTQRFVREAARYISTEKQSRFLLSPRVRAQLSSTGAQQFANVTIDPAQADYLLFYSSEAFDRKYWPAYTPALTKTWFGPFEVNLNYYPYWGGDDRIIVMSKTTAQKIDLRGVDYGSGNSGDSLTKGSNKALFVSQSVPASMIGGQSYDVAVTMKNTGETEWTANKSYRLGAQNPQDNPAWKEIRVELPSTIAPGALATFKFTITAPSATGSYNLQWRMVRDGVEWFGDYTPNVPFVSNYTAVRLDVSNQ